MAQQNKDKKVRRYVLTLVEDRTHKPLNSVKFTKPGAVLVVVNILVVLCALIYVFVAYTPLRTFIPGYPDAQTKRAAIQNAIRIDSLEKVICRWELYSENLRRVVEGDETVDVAGILTGTATSSLPPASDEEPDGISDAEFRDAVVSEEQFDLSSGQKRELPIEGIHFFSPLKGVVSKPYDKYVHPYVDLTAPENSLVMAPLDGTVIFTGWNDDAGYVIQIQHSDNIVSICQHTGKLLKKTGDKVTAGTPVALVGSAGNLALGDHLRFELWYRGESVDPAKYINF